jgi:hypothetical protein
MGSNSKLYSWSYCHPEPHNYFPAFTNLYGRSMLIQTLAETGVWPIRNDLNRGDALSPLLFNFAFEFFIRRAPVIQDGLKSNGTSALGLC